MKKVVLSAILLIISISFTLAQVPQAFKYQAIARDNSGLILANRAIALRISILSGTADGMSVYSETHSTLTNNFGLVNLDIGLGNDPAGKISGIKWGYGNYWLSIEMDENGGTDFRPMGVSQLLSVPYAIYSGTATTLTPPGGDSNGPGVPANVWSLFGNSNSNPLTDKLGTTDAADMVIVTSDIERMRIKSDGNIEMSRSLQIGENLTVKQNVFLNTVSGSTTNYGAFTVANLSPTLLSGTLTVDLATDLNSSLNVDGITDLNSAFHVNNASPSILTGTLLLNGDGTFNQHLLLDNASINSTLPSNGALMVRGGVGIGKNLNVGGNAIFDGNVTIKGPLALTDLTESTSTTTGALTVAGGVGIGKRLNVGGVTTLSNKLNANGQVTITANPGSGSQSNFTDYPLLVKGSPQGIAIKVNGSRTGSNNFVSFFDESGTNAMWGRIEGQTAGEMVSDPEWIYDQVIFGLEYIISLSNTIMAIIEQAGAGSSSTVCAGLGACVTAPVPSLIVAAFAKALIAWADLVIKSAEPIAYNAFKLANMGVTYSSGSGDYAEWLLKENPMETFYPGEIVGVTAGRISRNTTGADKVLVISLKPIVLGNMPEPGKESMYEKVAFMGQVPVRVFGKVKSGDCILPSGYANGIGIAVSPDKLKTEDYGQIVGIAWAGAEGEQMNVVNVAVGMNTNDAARLVAKQETKITELENQVSGLQTQLNHTNQLLAKLLPGFAEETGIAVTTATQETNVKPAQQGQVTVAAPSERTIVYFLVTKDQAQQGYELAESLMKEKGIDLDTHPFFKKMRTEPGYKDNLLNDMVESVNKAIKAKAEADSKSGSPVEIR